jgi:release factor glutamine methyltransferase
MRRKDSGQRSKQEPGSLGEAVDLAWRRLRSSSETPALDAQVLLGHILRRRRSWILAHPEAALNQAQSRRFAAGLHRLAQGEPLPYVLGEWEFYGRRFLLTPDVLIPRPETELLVETAAGLLRRRPQAGRLADIGTGSGVIAICLAVEFPALAMLASDCSLPALRVARRNARRHGVLDRLDLVQADLLTPFNGPFDLITANLPYIPTRRLESLPVSAWEPRMALDGGRRGEDLIVRLLEQSTRRLSKRGALALEIEAGQAGRLSSEARRLFSDGQIRVMPDLAGRPRLLVVERDVDG